MDLFEIRRNNLTYLIDINYRGNLSSFVRQINDDYTKYNLAINGKTNVSNKMARAVELALNLERGSLDKEDSFATDALAGCVKVTKYPFIAFDENPSFTGAGIGHVFISQQLISEFKREKRRLIAFVMNDDSMIPIIGAGSSIVVDTDDIEIVNNKLYMIAVGKHLEVRRLLHIIGDDKVLLKPENKQFKPEAIDLGRSDVKIIGRIIFQVSIMIDE